MVIGAYRKDDVPWHSYDGMGFRDELSGMEGV